MSGAGTFPAGAGPAGSDPVRAPSPRNPVTVAPAALFDPATGDMRFDANGRVVPVHPVDQAVALALTLNAGQVGSANDVGHALRSLPRGSSAQVIMAGKDAVKRALAPLVARGDIEVVAIDVTRPARGATLAVVSYRNLRLVPTTVQSARAVI